MALEIGGGSTVASYQSSLTGAPKKADPEGDALGRALQAGDLTAAREAFQKLAAHLPPGTLNNPNHPMAKVGKALLSDDLEAARAAFAQGRGTAVDKTLASGPRTVGVTGTKSGKARLGYELEQKAGNGFALQLSKAVQGGNVRLARTILDQMMADLQQMASLNSEGGPDHSTGYVKPVAASKALTSAITSADKILSNPDFQSLKQAVDRGDIVNMQAAWTAFIQGAMAVRSAQMQVQTAATTSSSAASTVVPPSAAPSRILGFSRQIGQVS
jgi:hypothetical protein